MVGGDVLDRRHRDLDADRDQRPGRGLRRVVLLRGARRRLPRRPGPRRVRAAAAVLPRRVRLGLPVPRAALRAEHPGARVADVPGDPAARGGRAAVRRRDPDQAAARRVRARRQLLRDRPGDHRGHRRLHLRRRHQGRRVDRLPADGALRRRRRDLRGRALDAGRRGRVGGRVGRREVHRLRLLEADPDQPLRVRHRGRRRGAAHDGLPRLGPADRPARALVPFALRRAQGDDRLGGGDRGAVRAVLAGRGAAVGPQPRRVAVVAAPDQRSALRRVHPARPARGPVRAARRRHPRRDDGVAVERAELAVDLDDRRPRGVLGTVAARPRGRC